MIHECVNGNSEPFSFFPFSHLLDPDVADVCLRLSTLFASDATSLSTLSICKLQYESSLKCEPEGQIVEGQIAT